MGRVSRGLVMGGGREPVSRECTSIILVFPSILFFTSLPPSLPSLPPSLPLPPSSPSWSKRAAHNRAQIVYYIAENLELRHSEVAKRIADMTGQ